MQDVGGEKLAGVWKLGQMRRAVVIQQIVVENPWMLSSSRVRRLLQKEQLVGWKL